MPREVEYLRLESIEDLPLSMLDNASFPEMGSCDTLSEMRSHGLFADLQTKWWTRIPA